jgi:adenosylcobinamide kinase/adenosylcobinamide-phosphate guanylyltransferase
MAIHLVLGGARSGKSAYAEKLALGSGLSVTYIATAQIFDHEFKARVEHHQAHRPENWRLIEAPHYLSAALEANNHASVGQCRIIDCLTLWLAQCVCPDCAPLESQEKNVNLWKSEREKFLTILPKLQGETILVSNEVGMGIVPLGEINRRFQDEQGRLNQAVARIADTVTFVAAGLPLKLKG